MRQSIFDKVAQWMLAEVTTAGYLDQETAADEIMTRFGDDSVYTNDNGNLAIKRQALQAFRRISEHTVVWERANAAGG